MRRQEIRLNKKHPLYPAYRACKGEERKKFEEGLRVLFLAFPSEDFHNLTVGELAGKVKEEIRQRFNSYLDLVTCSRILGKETLDGCRKLHQACVPLKLDVGPMPQEQKQEGGVLVAVGG